MAQGLQASQRGDLAEVERCYAAWKSNDTEDCCSDDDCYCGGLLTSGLEVAARNGHLHIINPILDWLGERSDAPVLRCLPDIAEKLLWVACRDGHLELAVKMLWKGDFACGKVKMFDVLRPVRPEAFLCTGEFFRKILQVLIERLDKTGQKINADWFKRVLVEAIKFRRRCHVETLLDEIDPDLLGRAVNFTDHPDLMQAVLRSRSTSILRCVLIRYPEAAIHNAECDPAVVIKKYHWPTGARLLVEAGVKCKDGVPREHAGIFFFFFFLPEYILQGWPDS